MLIFLQAEREKRIRAGQPNHHAEWHEVEVAACLNLLKNFAHDHPERDQSLTHPAAKLSGYLLAMPLGHYVLTDEPLIDCRAVGCPNNMPGVSRHDYTQDGAEIAD